MKKLHAFLICAIASALLFNGCDEEKDNKLFLLLFAGGMNNTPVVNLTASASPIAENGGTSTITASIPAAIGSDVTVVLELTGTPTAPADYTVAGSTTIVIPAGSTSGSTDVVITGADDALFEGDEDIVVGITSVTNATAGTAPTVRITDAEKGEMFFNTYTVHNYWPTTTIIDKNVSMTSTNGFVLSGDDYVAQFNYGGEIFAISLPNTVTGTSAYDSGDYPDGFSPSYTIYIDGWEFSQWIFDGYGDETDFTLQVTSLSGGRITATFSGHLNFGTIETLYVNSSIGGGTLSAAIGE